MPLLIVNGRVFDGTGDSAHSGWAVLTQGKTLSFVGPLEAPGPLPPDTTVVDAAGLTVLPGLIDLHVHLIFHLERGYSHQAERAVAHSTLAGLRNAETALRWGITTVRDCGAPHLGIFALREAINAGEVAGSRVFAAGRAISMTGGSSWQTISREADGPDDCRRATREQFRGSGGYPEIGAGADHIKVMATDLGYHRTRVQLSVDEMKAIVEEAEHREGRVCAHVGGAAGAINCARAGVQCVEHGNVLDTESIDNMRRAGTAYVPTLTTYREPAVLGVDGGFTEFEAGYCRMYYEAHRESFTRALDAGLRIGVGTDTGGRYHPIGQATHREMALMVDYGMSPAQALRAATSEAAQILNGGADFGHLAPGKTADILVVDGDPLSDIRATERIWLLVKDGQVAIDRRSMPGATARLHLAPGHDSAEASTERETRHEP